MCERKQIKGKIGQCTKKMPLILQCITGDEFVNKYHFATLSDAEI